jgi:hypothetical protein
MSLDSGIETPSDEPDEEGEHEERINHAAEDFDSYELADGHDDRRELFPCKA